MSAWGTGLYSGDFAADLRSTIAAVIRLPFDINRLVEILCETEPTAANDPEESDHTVFWLVVADQFIKHGIVSDRVRNTALSILDSGKDIAVHESLGMTRSDLAQRRKKLAILRAKLTSSVQTPKTRKCLKHPQPLLMNVGDLVIYPTCRGECINPYFRDKELIRTGWKSDGWGVLLVIDCGRAFDFLAWYRALTIVDSMQQKPNVDCLLSRVEWVLRSPGTCTDNHFKRMQFEAIHQVTIDGIRLRQCFPDLRSGLNEAVQDLSIGNELNIGPKKKDFFGWEQRSDGEYVKVPIPTISSLAKITAK